MHTTPQLIELAKQRLAFRHGLPTPMTDYRLGKLLDIAQPTISRWRTGHTHIGTEFAARFAEACELPGEYVYACIERERAEDPALRTILERIAERFANHAAVIAALAIMAAGMIPASSIKAADFARSEVAHDIHYAHYDIAALKRELRIRSRAGSSPLSMDCGTATRDRSSTLCS